MTLRTAINKRIDTLDTLALVKLLTHLDLTQNEFTYRDGNLYQLTLVSDTTDSTGTLADQLSLTPPNTSRYVAVMYEGKEYIGWYYDGHRDHGWRIQDSSNRRIHDLDGLAASSKVTSWREGTPSQPDRPLDYRGNPDIRDVLVTVEGVDGEHIGWCSTSGEWQVIAVDSPFVVTAWRELDEQPSN